MCGNHLSALLVSAWLLIARVTTYRVTMTPADNIHLPTSLETVTFTCSADVALTGCQFMWWDRDTKAGPLLDLSQGPLSQANSSHLTTEMTGYSYSGRGLGAGDCGVSLKVKGFKSWTVACRVRAGNGGWTYERTDLRCASNLILPHTVTPREAVVFPGREARFALKSQDPLSDCHFYPPGRDLDFSQGARSASSTGRHRYLGFGLEQGQCGLVLSNVSEEDNGPVKGLMYSINHMDTSRFMALIVARPPSTPTLNVVYTDAGATATCMVPEIRPAAAIITWILGDDVLRQDSQDDSPGNSQDAWRWPWTQGSVLQRVTLTRQAKDNGKRLKCVVSHVTLDQPLKVTETISFTESVCEVSPLGQDNKSCPRLDELRVREAGAAARTAELAEEQAKVTLEVAKVSLETAKVTLETAKFGLEAAKSSASLEAVRGRKEES